MYQSRIRNAKKRTGRQEKNRTIFEPDDSQDYAIVTSNARKWSSYGDLQRRRFPDGTHSWKHAKIWRKGHHFKQATSF